MSKLLAPVALLVIGAGSVCLAQPGTGGTISSGNTTFTQGNAPTSSLALGPLANLSVGGDANPDHLVQSWWWARIDTLDTSENCLNSATSAVWAGDTSTVTYAFAIPLTSEVVQHSRVEGLATGGRLIEEITQINTSSVTQRWTAFHYLDLNLAGTAAGDVAVLDGDRIRISDGPWVAEYEGSDTYQVGSFASVRNLLTNAVVDTFDNSGLPYAAANWTGGYQYTFTLAPGESITLTARITIVPAAPSLITALLGLSVYARRARRKD
ncbi:MAG: hypothetical protein H7Y88_00890 [Phycisphaerales bacterium]|nr:hypothetical protein [Phycisphaerales bacterium]